MGNQTSDTFFLFFCLWTFGDHSHKRLLVPGQTLTSKEAFKRTGDFCFAFSLCKKRRERPERHLLYLLFRWKNLEFVYYCWGFMFTSSYASAVKRNAIFKKQKPTQASICRAFLPLPVSPPSCDRWPRTYKPSQCSGGDSFPASLSFRDHTWVSTLSRQSSVQFNLS